MSLAVQLSDCPSRTLSHRIRSLQRLLDTELKGRLVSADLYLRVRANRTDDERADTSELCWP